MPFVCGIHGLFCLFSARSVRPMPAHAPGAHGPAGVLHPQGALYGETKDGNTTPSRSQEPGQGTGTGNPDDGRRKGVPGPQGLPGRRTSSGPVPRHPRGEIGHPQGDPLAVPHQGGHALPLRVGGDQGPLRAGDQAGGAPAPAGNPAGPARVPGRGSSGAGPGGGPVGVQVHRHGPHEQRGRLLPGPAHGPGVPGQGALPQRQGCEQDPGTGIEEGERGEQRVGGDAPPARGPGAAALEPPGPAGCPAAGGARGGDSGGTG